MRTIHKYTLERRGLTTIEMPFDAKVLSAHNQRESLVIWALIETAQPTLMRTFACHGTGQPVPEYPGRFIGTGQPVPEYPGRFIGTAQFDSGECVVHVFEVG